MITGRAVRGYSRRTARMGTGEAPEAWEVGKLGRISDIKVEGVCKSDKKISVK